MVTITDYNRRESEDGREFFTLTIEGDVEIVQSANGKSYMTSRKTSIPSTFGENVCQSLIGKQMPGEIVKEECEGYEYQNKETGEFVTLYHTYIYVCEEKQAEKPVLEQPLVPFSMNGQSVFAQA